MAVLNPIPISPISGEGVDASNAIRVQWDFVSTASETQNSFQVRVYLITNTATAVHDSGVVSSSLEYYDIPSSTLTNGNDYVWKVEVVSGAITRENSRFALFKTVSTPSLTIDTLGSVGQFVNPTATYSQAESVAVRSYQWKLYDNNDVLLVTRPVKFGTPITDTFTGLVNGTTYKLEVTTINQNNVTTTSSRVTFTSSYTIPIDSPTIDVTSRSDIASIEVGWEDIVVLNGQVVGSFAYVAGKFNKALQLQNACLNLDLSSFLVPAQNTIAFWLKLPTDFDGDFFRMKKAGNVEYRVGFNNEKNKFYYERGHRFVLGTPVTLPSNYFLVVLSPTQVQIAFYDISDVETNRYIIR